MDRDRLGRFVKGHRQTNTDRTHFQKGLMPQNNNIHNLIMLPEDIHKSMHGKLNYPKGSKFGINIKGGGLRWQS